MRIILGAGIAGLVMHEILKAKGEDYSIVTNDLNNIGGQMKNNFPLGPRILQYSKKVKSFLKHIGIEKEPRIFKVGYYNGEEVVSTITKEQKEIYYLKTRGNNKINKTTLSEGKNEILGWDINEINLVNVLYERNKGSIVGLDVYHIDPVNNYINFNLKYTDLISTIPLDVLNNLSLGKQHFNLSKRTVYFHYIKCEVDELDKYDYVYNVTNSVVNRLTKVDDKHIIIEASEPLKHPGLIEMKAAKTQIEHELKLDNYKGIKLVGRYAQHDHSIKTNNIIDKYWQGDKHGR